MNKSFVMPKVTTKPIPKRTSSQIDNKLYIVKTFDSDSIEHNAYFKSLSDAVIFVENNICDINDGGSYNFAMIQEVNYNQAYTEFVTFEKIFFYFDYNIDRFVEMTGEQVENAKVKCKYFR